MTSFPACRLAMLVLSAAAFCFLSCLSRPLSPAALPYKQARRLMGTFCEIEVYHPDAKYAKQAMAEALDEMQRVERLLSNYDPSSPLSMMNREASRSPFRVPAELYDFLKECRALHAATLGAFDPTVGPLVRAWGFFGSAPARPSEAAVATAKAKVGFGKVILDDSARSVFYSVPGMEIDTSGIGKGYAVDRAARALRRRNIEAALVNAGGSTLYAIGRPPGRPYWRVGIRNPEDIQHLFAIARLTDASVSTSGTAVRAARAGARVFSHIFDPRTGEPVEGLCQVSVVAPSATESEAFGKAAFILSRDALSRLAAERPRMHILRVEGACSGKFSIWQTPSPSPAFGPPDRP